MDVQKEITKKLQSIVGKHSINVVFSDWIHLMAFSLSNSTDKQNFDTRESLYLDTIRKYSKDQASVFCECTGLLTIGLEMKKMDWLGTIFQSLHLSNKAMGQCFTPHHIACLMADLSFQSTINEIEKKGYAFYYEPCCGSGSLVLGFISVMREKGNNYQSQLVVQIEDLDELCLLMAYVQLSLLGVNATCQVKNSLSNEVFSTWKTPFHFILGNHFHPISH